MSLAACAQLLKRGDPDRFLAIMAAPVWARRVLLPLYAFNLELARAAWASSEPVIAQMRLQFWHDVLTQISRKKAPAQHDIATALAQILTPSDANELRSMVVAREQDLERAPFSDVAALMGYCRDTSGCLVQLSAVRLGAQAHERPSCRQWGAAMGLAQYLRAVPHLVARGHSPLPDGVRNDQLAQLARQTLTDLPVLPRQVPYEIAKLPGWQTTMLLKRVARNPHLVYNARLEYSEFRKRAALIIAQRRIK